MLTSSFAITQAFGQLGSGYLADRWESRRFISGGVALYALMNALIATARSAPWLVAWRSLAGFGGGAMIVSERIYITEVTRPDRRAFANGVISAAQSTGSVAGPAIGGLVASVAGLRAPFILVAVTSTIALLATFFLPRPASRDRIQEPTGAPAVVATPYRPLATLLVANVAFMASYGAFITTYAPFATLRLGWTTLDIGIAFSFFGIGSIVLGPALAHLADRHGRRTVAALAPIPIATFALALVAGLPQPVIYTTAVIAGGGLTAFSASWYALLADVAGERRRGRTFGVMSAISNGGIVVGALVAADLWTRLDIGAGVWSAITALALAALAMAAFRPPDATAVAVP